MPDLLTGDQLRELSQTKPPWQPGDTLRLEHPRAVTHHIIGRAWSSHTMQTLFRDIDGTWLVRIEGTTEGFYSGRFSLASPAPKVRLKTNHKLGAPKGKLP